MPSFKIRVARHGQDQDNEDSILNGHRNQPLTALGQKQAQQAAQNISENTEWGTKLDFIFSSPLQRANNTAKAIAAAINNKNDEKKLPPLEVVVLDNLIERDFGELTGKPLADIMKLPEEFVLKTDKVNYFLKAEGSEDFDTLMKRARAVIEEAKSYASKKLEEEKKTTQEEVSILLVCHGDLMKMMLGIAKNLSWKEALMAPYIANTEVLEL